LVNLFLSIFEDMISAFEYLCQPRPGAIHV